MYDGDVLSCSESTCTGTIGKTSKNQVTELSIMPSTLGDATLHRVITGLQYRSLPSVRNERLDNHNRISLCSIRPTSAVCIHPQSFFLPLRIRLPRTRNPATRHHVNTLYKLSEGIRLLAILHRRCRRQLPQCVGHDGCVHGRPHYDQRPKRRRQLRMDRLSIWPCKHFNLTVLRSSRRCLWEEADHAHLHRYLPPWKRSCRCSADYELANRCTKYVFIRRYLSSN